MVSLSDLYTGSAKIVNSKRKQEMNLSASTQIQANQWLLLLEMHPLKVACCRNGISISGVVNKCPCIHSSADLDIHRVQKKTPTLVSCIILRNSNLFE